MADTEVKTLITVKADTAHAAAEMKKLAAATDATTASLKKQTEQAGLVGGKLNELGKSMVGLQMHDTFVKASKAVDDFTGGVVDLNAAYAGYQVGGVYGAVIGGIGVAAVKSAGVLSGFGSEMERIRAEANKSEAPLTAYNDHLKDIQGRAVAAALALLTVNDRFAAGRKIIDLANQQLIGYNSTVSTLTRGLSSLSKAAPDAITALAGRLFGIDQWSGGPKFAKAGGGGTKPDNSEILRLLQSVTSRQAGSREPYSGYGADESLKAERYAQDEWLTAWNKKLDQGAGRAPKAKSEMESSFNLDAQLGSKAGSPHMDRVRADQSYMESKFGPSSQFDAYVAGATSWADALGGVVAKIDVVGNGFNALSNAAVAGYDAMVDGTMSFGKAFKKSIADSLKALGGQMLIEALKETAYGVASLATFNYGGAALHFKAAGGFALAATAAGVAAHSMGGGGGASASASRPSAPSVGAGGSSGGGGNTTQTIIVYGDALAENSPRGQQVLAKKIIQKALGSTAVEAS